jgi:hypothetical protein
MSSTYTVHAKNLDKVVSEIEAINKRIARLVKRGHKVDPVVITVSPLFSEGDSVFATVELTSPEMPKIPGWDFIAALTHVEDAGTVLRVVPGAKVEEGELKAYRTAAPICDHCNTIRNRKESFIVRNSEGALRQVGRQCLQEYTGLGNPAEICAIAEILCSVSDLLRCASKEGETGGIRNFFTIAEFLPFVACSIREHGWLSRTAAYEKTGDRYNSTCDLAIIYGINSKAKNKYEPTEEDYNLAAATISFISDHFADCDINALSDYENSLRVAMTSGIVRPKLEGIVASAISFYKRDIERRSRNEAWHKMVGNSCYQGTVGEKGLFEDLQVLSHRECQSDWGVTHLYSFVDDNGNAFTYFASRNINLEPGQRVSLRGTVKKHQAYTPRFPGATSYKQTLLTRCSLVARAKVTSYEMVKKDEKKSHVYVLEGLDGRGFVLVSSSKKKLAVGQVAVVSYCAEDLSAFNNGLRPVSLISVA